MKRRKYQHIVETVVNSPAKSQGNFRATAELVTELLCQHLTIDAASAWRFSLDLCRQYAVAQFAQQGAGFQFRGTDISRCNQYLHFLKSQRYIDASDAKADQRVADIRLLFLTPRHISSTLDVAIRINGRLEGVLCLERSQSQGAWQDSEIYIACQCADQLALTLATQQGYEQQEILSLFQSAVEQSDYVTMLVNLKTELIEYINPAHSRMSGMARDKIQGHSVRNLAFFSQYPDHADLVMDELRAGKPVSGEVPLTRPDGKRYYLKYHASPFVTERHNIYALVHSEDNTRPHLYQAELERLAWCCGLTGLFNRTHFNQVLDRTREGVLILVDLLGFKRFNDTYGHEQGDALLVEMARRIRHFADIHSAIEIARVGSDEFALLLPGVSPERCKARVERLYQQLSQQIVVGREQLDPKPALAIVNIGEVADVISPMAGADIAVQYAKKKQANHVQFFNSALVSSFYQDSEIERELHVAIRGRQFELYYQPLRDLKTQEYIGAEALIRWHHPKKGVLYPGSFIDVAEQSGLIGSIGNWVLEAACKQLNLWQHHNINLSMHVNVSARQFFGGQLYEQVWQLLTRYRIKPRTLILEITETELMEDVLHTTHLCKELSELGVGLAIDDFGTGYSSMRYLKQFPISKIKIDRSFIADLTVSRESREIVSAIIAMAKALNISLTAEGVETSEQEAFLSDCECHQAQGFLYSPALRGPDFNDFINLKDRQKDLV
ncbi:putative bifunctional diguanylate cyclase/phosphodiesterase [Shewanella sp. GXUN23E]|uniref:putative bifunctional diguanylate cyclase/phosphodiesterase n=1 Tax=Shewanella sp. GXUN23E TaxID=3422498 RepID=UPI003D7DC06D